MNWNTILKPYLLLVISFSLLDNSFAQNKDLQTNLAVRAIGDEFLMQLNDSTSRILPVEKEGSRFVLKFEREFAFEPTLLSFSTYKILKEFGFKNRFVVEVQICDSFQVIYGFEANLEKDEKEIACRLRGLPRNCYVFYFTPLDANNEEAAVDSSMQINGFSGWLVILFIGLICTGVIFLILSKKNVKINDHLIEIGQFQFDQKGMTLTLKSISFELSSKETDLLYLLYSNENKTVAREVILNKIWGDEGDYVGRTLDVFISKLRKKLEADSAVKIINVRGVGYRLVITK